jgi:hypothetical protein
LATKPPKYFRCPKNRHIEFFFFGFLGRGQHFHATGTPLYLHHPIFAKANVQTPVTTISET